jgi:hypothetical protein
VLLLGALQLPLLCWRALAQPLLARGPGLPRHGCWWCLLAELLLVRRLVLLVRLLLLLLRSAQALLPPVYCWRLLTPQLLAAVSGAALATAAPACWGRDRVRVWQQHCSLRPEP